jgi:uncharacterized membrane protein
MHDRADVALLAPGRSDHVLGGGALVVLAAMSAAIIRGQAEWGQIPPVVWLHLATITIALVLTPVLLWQRRGTPRHRKLGYVWVSAMALTALDSLFIRLIGRGGFSVIHILSAWTLIQVPLIVLAARRHDWKRHRGAVRGMVIGALLIAGFFTFPFDRLLGRWLFG